MTQMLLYTDGGARGNPGPAGIGGQLFQNTTVIAEFSEYIGEATNNWAEYEALLRGLALVADMPEKPTGLEVKMDSELIVKQMRGEYKVKDKELKLQHEKCKALIEKIGVPVTFTHVRREANKEADRLVNEALDNALG